MDLSQAHPKPLSSWRSGKNLAGWTLLAVVGGFCSQVTLKSIEYESFTRHASQLTKAFTAAGAAKEPLGHFKDQFHTLATSDMGFGRMLAIAYVERTGSIRERDQSIINAANDLNGNELYRLSKAASPMFDPAARQRYIEGVRPDVSFPGVDMSVSTFTAVQQVAMEQCLAKLEPEYQNKDLLVRLKVAAAIYAGVRWESCHIPAAPSYRGSTVPVDQTI